MEIILDFTNLNFPLNPSVINLTNSPLILKLVNSPLTLNPFKFKPEAKYLK